MRVDDRPVPTVVGPRPGPGGPTAGWPAEVYFAVEKVETDVYAWDDYTAAWDEASKVWDYLPVITSTHVDVTCDLAGFEIEVGSPDVEGRFRAGELRATLLNQSGRWSQYDAQGRLVDFLPGRAVDVWAVLDGAPWWLYSGEISAWEERADGTVEITAVDVFPRFNQPIGTWNPGHYGDRPSVRLDSICALIGYTGRRRFDPGDVALHSFESSASPLEEMQATALSDGGVIAVDADGTLLYRDRTWPGGRSDQSEIPIWSDNVCAAPIIGWEVEIVTDDTATVNLARLTNLAEITVEARDQAAINLHGLYALPPRDNDQWIEADQGQRLADWTVGRRSDAYLRVESILFYLSGLPAEQWRTAIDLRLGDVVELLHSQETTTGPAILDLYLVVQSIRHAVTPEGWVTTVGTTRTVGNRPTQRWDQSAYAWDDPSPVNAWSY